MVLPAADSLVRSRDSQLRYRPDSELFYLTGVAEPGVVAVLVGNDEPRFVLFVTPPDERSALWDGPRLAPEEAARRYGADECRPMAELDERLPRLLARATGIHYAVGETGPEHAAVWPHVETSLRRSRVGGRKGVGPRSVVDPGVILDELRLRKDASEIHAVREAVRATVAGHLAAAAAVEPGASERSVEGALEGAFRREGAEGSAFAPIVASGPNALVLHYSANSRTMRNGELALVDAGAELNMYAGDVSRTYPVNGRFTVEQRAVYEIVLRARRAALDQVRPGVPLAAVHEAAARAIIEGLCAIGEIDGEIDELASRKAHRPFFPHRVGHWIGLDVHDPGDCRRDGASRMLEEGMALTVEPGLYLRPGVASPPYEGIGVRIEDDVLVTAEGSEVLSDALPVAADEVEALVRSA